MYQDIFIKGARANNLKNIDLTIPKNKLVVVTGVSGSGKSSITMDTLFAEGQRRYVESLSSYARQFLMRMKKPEVDVIKGICPAIAIEQKVTTGNARSTVGTLTEVYDFLRLLYARIGKTFSPISGNIVKKHEVSDVIDFINALNEGTKVLLTIPIHTKHTNRTLTQELNLLLQKGYSRVLLQGELVPIEELGAQHFSAEAFVGDAAQLDLQVLIDRFVVNKNDAENTKRMADSVQTAFYESEGECVITVLKEKGKPTKQLFNNRFELDGILFVEPTPQLFNFNNSLGACKKCEGYGKVMGIDENKVIPNKLKSVYEGAIACWNGEKGNQWLAELLQHAHRFDFPLHTPYQNLTKAQRKLLWAGNQYFNGIDAYFADLEANLYKIQNRVMLSRYRGKTTCPECQGSRLSQEATYVKINSTQISDLVEMPIETLAKWFEALTLSEHDQHIARRLLIEINNRLSFMLKLGLSYLTLSRISSTLSGGETQRINLTRMLGSNLTASMYILDEPSVGLHPRDSERLVAVLKSLRDLGNTVIVVEHEEDIIKNADYLVDIGPHAGIHGGEVVFAGAYKNIFKLAKDSLTTGYMSGRMAIAVPRVRRKAISYITLPQANLHNLKNITVNFPLNTMTVICGVSGSGKTTLVKQLLHPALARYFEARETDKKAKTNELEGSISLLTQVEMINQSPIGKSSRSNPITYVKAYDYIRDLMASQQLSKIRGYKSGHFSFNVEGGRCETCKGDGEQVVEMQFLADIRLECEECKGKRFRSEILEVQYKEKDISEILNMSVDDALVFFEKEKEIINRMKPLHDVGLGYVKLGQSSSTLSGGEAQRVKLASFLTKEKSDERIFFIFDEPTTGLHFHDVQRLLDALQALVERGHTVLVVEHNLEVIKCADWVIELGPEGGNVGGNWVFEGTPEEMAKSKNSPTAIYLKEKLG